MALFRIATPARNAAVGAVAALLDTGPAAGTIKIYTGAPPATPATTPSGTLLATVTLGKPAFGAPATGVVTGAAVAAVNAAVSGKAGWFRAADSAGATVGDGDVTATGGGGTMTLSTVDLTAGSPVNITSLTLTMPAS